VAKVRTPRGASVDASLQALATGGPDAIRVARSILAFSLFIDSTA